MSTRKYFIDNEMSESLTPEWTDYVDVVVESFVQSGYIPIDNYAGKPNSEGVLLRSKMGVYVSLHLTRHEQQGRELEDAGQAGSAGWIDYSVIVSKAVLRPCVLDISRLPGDRVTMSGVAYRVGVLKGVSYQGPFGWGNWVNEDSVRESIKLRKILGRA